MKRIRVFGKRTNSGYNLSSIKVIKDDKAVTDECRNTVYNVLRLKSRKSDNNREYFILVNDGVLQCKGEDFLVLKSIPDAREYFILVNDGVLQCKGEDFLVLKSI